MKLWLPLILSSLLCFSCGEPVAKSSQPSDDPFPLDFTLTDIKGRDLPSTILAKSGERLLVRRKSDQSEFVVSLSSLSENSRRLLEVLPDKDRESVDNFAEHSAREKLLQGRRATWHRDIDNALREAAEVKLPILLIFLKTSDEPSDLFNRNVLNTDTFRNWADGHAVLCIYYNNSAQDTESLNGISTREGREIAARYKAGSRSPTAVILSSSGKRLKRLVGFDGGTAKNYLDQLSGFF